ncbi:MAG: protein-L-isoaspartate O-methyltransferase family protein [Rhodospirillaceae bacterium]
MDYALARANMVANQIQTNRVTDPLVIEAMGAVPREPFLATGYKGVAYVDEDLPLTEGRWLLEPVSMGRMLQTAAIKEGDLVLDVGCATGYSTAVLSRMAGTVVAVESNEELVAKATESLVELGTDNAVVIPGSLREGYAKQAPYDVIIIACGSIPSVPTELRDQLADGGRLVALVNEGGSGRIVLISRHGEAFGQRVMYDASSPVVSDFVDAEEFVF